MKQYQASIQITLKKGILDVQGKAVENALHAIEFPMLSNLRIGKYVEMIVEADDKEKATASVIDACNKLVANPIIEDFKINLTEIESQ
ncbi:MAG: phosphoribosylformylglycinamidine synthase, purS protein [Ignavibacteria bacterium GWB2_35_12]|nr:MAG: phosphoribosylformylglycinamidine synthase, purS protein [Ignavibacteria bacterium GWB2_35_12]OGU93850.1 MAG: phosphoribosylformylglycinamidine synthase, purS protein [Ignavibacteria bacterium RIFOXYA2_FULL_35_10]OGV22059.1 MAG: phosphoribosylformylglycinamidine synthase, purS protein [Ignavibacteria bacterium RIFOXYC2_FULL_35_21]